MQKGAAVDRYLYEAILTPYDDMYEVYFPELNLYTQGTSLADAAYMAQDLLTMDIAERLEAGEDVPHIGSFGAAGAISAGSIAMGIMALVEAGCERTETMTVAEAADILNVSRARIYALVKEGAIRSEKAGSSAYSTLKTLWTVLTARAIPVDRPSIATGQSRCCRRLRWGAATPATAAKSEQAL